MKKLLLSVFLTKAAILAAAQQDFKRNDIYLEAFGNGLFSSLNYERQLTKQPGLGMRFGVGFYTENVFYLTILSGVNYLFPLKGGKSFIDAGAGVTFARIDGQLFEPSKNSRGNHFTNFIPSIGYRKHAKNDLMWRISLTPVANKFAFTPSLGASVGKRF